MPHTLPPVLMSVSVSKLAYKLQNKLSKTKCGTLLEGYQIVIAVMALQM